MHLALEIPKLRKMRLFRLLAPFPRQLGCAAVFFLVFAANRIMADSLDTNAAVSWIKKSFQENQKRFGSNTNDTVSAWQFGRSCFDVSSLQTEPALQANFAEQGISACRASLNSNSVQAHYYLGMNIGQVADAKHNLSSLHMTKDMEREFLAAQALDKTFDYGGADRNLGLLYRDSPSLLGIGSRSKAHTHLEAAVQLAPDFPENRLNLLEGQIKWGHHADAIRELDALEKLWAAAKAKYTGVDWTLSWVDWEKRIAIIRKKLGEPSSKLNEPPHSPP